jgi:hypothetical protein
MIDLENVGDSESSILYKTAKPCAPRRFSGRHEVARNGQRLWTIEVSA